jgi:hypothetical protein
MSLGGAGFALDNLAQVRKMSAYLFTAMNNYS